MQKGAPSVGVQVMSAMLANGAGYAWPGTWSQDRYEQALHYRHWTYIALHIYGDAIAQLTPNFAMVRAGKPWQERSWAEQRWLQVRYEKTMGAIRPHEEIEPLGEEFPLVRLFNRPNEVDVARNFWFELCLFYKLMGNSYVWVIPNRAGFPAELWILPAHWVFPRPSRGRLVGHYEIRPWLGPGMIVIPCEEIIHIKDPSPIHKVDGWSAQQAGSEWIDIGEKINRGQFNTFVNGTSPSYLAVELDGEKFRPDEEELQRAYEKIYERMQGVINYGKPLIAPPGATFKNLGFPPNEMQWLESGDKMRDNVLALYHVPKEIAGVEPAGDNISRYAGEVHFNHYAINPTTNYLGQVFTASLCKRYDESCRMWWDDATPVDPAQVNADLKTDFECGLGTPNEGRAIRGKPPYKQGGDDPLLPTSIMPMPLNTGDDMSDFLPPVAEPPAGAVDGNPNTGPPVEPPRTGGGASGDADRDRANDQKSHTGTGRGALVKQVTDVVTEIRGSQDGLAAALVAIAKAQQDQTAEMARTREAMVALAREATGKPVEIRVEPQPANVSIHQTNQPNDVSLNLTFEGTKTEQHFLVQMPAVEKSDPTPYQIVVQPSDTKIEHVIVPPSTVVIEQPKPMDREMEYDDDGNLIRMRDKPQKE